MVVVPSGIPSISIHNCSEWEHYGKTSCGPEHILQIVFIYDHFNFWYDFYHQLILHLDLEIFTSGFHMRNAASF